MIKRAVSQEDEYAKARRLKRRRHKILTVMAAIVVFCTVYALILPAVTLEKNNTQKIEEMLSCTVECLASPDTEAIMVVSDELDMVERLRIEDYISEATIFYKTDTITEWTVITGNETNIPGDASFKLENSFENVNIDALISAGYEMTYILPDIFRDATVSAKITSGSKAVGTMTAQNGVVVLNFDKTWIDEQKEEKKDVLNGSFFVEAKANLSSIPEDGTTNITLGDANITINFESDLIAKYGNVDIEKTLGELEETEDGDFLNYTLTVTAGADGCPNVKVVDNFILEPNKACYVESYVIDQEGESVTVDTNHTLTWAIGEMAGGETRTLTYKVKLKEGYLGVAPKDAITNSATVYSKDYLRDTDSETFTPQGKATLSKVAADYVPDENGGGTI